MGLSDAVFLTVRRCAHQASPLVTADHGTEHDVVKFLWFHEDLITCANQGVVPAYHRHGSGSGSHL